MVVPTLVVLFLDAEMICSPCRPYVPVTVSTGRQAAAGVTKSGTPWKERVQEDRIAHGFSQPAASVQFGDSQVMCSFVLFVLLCILSCLYYRRVCVLKNAREECETLTPRSLPYALHFFQINFNNSC